MMQVSTLDTIISYLREIFGQTIFEVGSETLATPYSLAEETKCRTPLSPIVRARSASFRYTGSSRESIF